MSALHCCVLLSYILSVIVYYYISLSVVSVSQSRLEVIVSAFEQWLFAIVWRCTVKRIKGLGGRTLPLPFSLLHLLSGQWAFPLHLQVISRINIAPQLLLRWPPQTALPQQLPEQLHNGTAAHAANPVACEEL